MPRLSRSRVAEGEGFEPSKELVTPYSLSRRALSASQSSLRVAARVYATAPGIGMGGYFRGMDPVEALERIATLLERERAGRYKEEAFRRAADAVRGQSLDDLRALATQGRLADLP